METVNRRRERERLKRRPECSAEPVAYRPRCLRAAKRQTSREQTEGQLGYVPDAVAARVSVDFVDQIARRRRFGLDDSHDVTDPLLDVTAERSRSALRDRADETTIVPRP